MKLSSQQRWALSVLAAGDERTTTAGTAEQSLGAVTMRGLVRLGLVVESRDGRGVRRVSLTDAGRAQIARAA